MSSWFGRKKRKIDDQGSTVGGGGDGGSTEEITLNKTMTEIMNQNRDMLQMLNSMQGEMKNIQGEMKKMQNSMKIMNFSMQNMQKRQSSMESSMQTMHNKQNCNTTKLRDIRGRFEKAENKQKYHEILLKNQKWEYSVPRPDLEFWDGLPVDGGELAEAQDFLDQIKKQTEIMRFGSSDNGRIIIDNSIAYHSEFLPHWKEFADALEQYQYHLQISDYDGESNFTLYHVALSTEVINLLSKALESTYFHEFVLQNNELDKNGIKFALDYLESNRICKQFSLPDNLMSMDDINQLCQIVKDHPSVRNLGLSECKGAGINGYEVLKQIMTAGRNKLEVIDLADNNINTGGDTFISDFLAKNPILEIIELTGNELDENDAILVARALKRNTKLRLLEIQDNNFTNLGWEALSKAVFDNSSLNCAANSNHTCHIDFPSNHKYDHVRSINSDESSDHYLEPNLVRQKKIYSILSKRNKSSSNVVHLEDVPVELLPDMLYSIQQYSSYHDPEIGFEEEVTPPPRDTLDVEPLSIMYEICRHGNEALAVFEALNSPSSSIPLR